MHVLQRQSGSRRSAAGGAATTAAIRAVSACSCLRNTFDRGLPPLQEDVMMKILIAAVLGITLTVPALADARRGGLYGWHAGGYYRSYYGGAWGWWGWPVSPFFPGAFPYNMPRPIIYVNPAAPINTIPLAPQPVQYWYWCEGANAYYPYVQSCPGGWQAVPAVPSAPN
jgi:hypothetical protein